jgi:hypothetical protein
MARWMGLFSEWLKRVYVEIKAQMIRYLDPGNGKTGQGYLWVAHQPGGDVI